MAEQKVKLTQLPEATDTIDAAVLLVNQNETDQRLPITHFLRSKNNLPAHSHTVNLTTDLYDHGTIDTTNNGSHIHTGNIGRSGGSITTIAGATADVGWTSNAVMKAAGDHVHKTQIGAHSHKVKGNTNDSGSGEQVNITNSFIKLAGWYRTA